MQPIIRTIESKKLIGKRHTMSFSDDQTFVLWSGFMPHRKSIPHTINTDLISMQIYPKTFDFKHFDPTIPFEKWAAVEVDYFGNIPENMESFTIPKGTYAIFLHRGPASDGQKTFEYIFCDWLPQSGYVVDDRPHFEVLGERYKNDDPESEEEIWIPIKPKP